MLVIVGILETFGCTLNLIIQFFYSRWKCLDKKIRVMVFVIAFFATWVWWTRRSNSTCISHETTPTYRFSLAAYSMEKSFHICFTKPQIEHSDNRFIKWNSLNYICTISNVDGRCNDMLTRTGFGGTFRTLFGTWQSDFSRFILNSSIIFQEELWTIHKGTSLAKGISIIDLTC